MPPPAGRRTNETTQSPRLTTSHHQIETVMSQDSQNLENMRRRMSEAMARKQEQMAQSSSDLDSPTTTQSNLVGDQPSGPSSASGSSLLAGTAATSSESGKTIKASYDMMPGAIRTPSYPFPRMQMKLSRGLSQRSGPHHRPFTLLSPTAEPPEMERMKSTGTPGQMTSSDLSTPMNETDTQIFPEDPNYPTPDLYDMVLMLSTEPGLESWWSNVVEILAEAYGAERASLALPGDTADLENVPWGQKASFNVTGTGTDESITHPFPSEIDTLSERRDVAGTPPDTPTGTRRPLLTTRHSIAGGQPETQTPPGRSRPGAPPRAISTISELRRLQDNVTTPSIPRLTPQTAASRSESTLEEQINLGQPGSATSGYKCSVYRSLRPLETEVDPLLGRTGVVSLFGKRKPVVLTRQYSDEPGGRDMLHATSQPAQPAPQYSRHASLSTVRAFEEYEQPEPSPWSQSPAPSPAARPDPTESPFFVQQPPRIDEEAFAQDAPVYDYASTANQPISAIATDSAKTLVHIPLIQPVPSRNVLASSLRFPIAIISFLSPITPYPRNLRYSLFALLPHLASSFSLAQQYSSLQDRVRGGTTVHGASFGLGGTFSDEGSELELMNELSTQIQYDKALSKTSSLAGSVYSASDRASVPRSPGSQAGTPFLESFLTAEQPPTPSREMIDSYFTTKRNRSGQGSTKPSTPGPKQTKETSPESTKKTSSQGSTRKPAGTESRARTDAPAQPSNIRTTGFSYETSDLYTTPTSMEKSDTSVRRSAHRDSIRPEDSEKPLPEMIATLMLNAVPLQLFLAKPTTGDLVWTNRKFDAFRSQDEGRTRDPWKNVHSTDRPALIQQWKEALKKGTQFTHYVRVRRFNSDNDYRWFVFRASTMLSGGGRLLYWIGSFLDIHEQYMKNLEAQEMQATMARDAKLRALADAIPQVLFEAVEGEGIVAVNQQWHTFSGQTLDEARGLGFARHVYRDDLHKCGMLSPADLVRQKSSSGSSSGSSSTTRVAQTNPGRSRSLFAPDDSALATMIRLGSISAEKDENGRTSYSTEIRLRSKKGEFRWFLVRLVKIAQNESESPTVQKASWYGTCTDIEVRMQLEADLNEANKKVHSEMESKTKFFANMSHEIRTPLNGILGSMPWLVESQLDHDQRRTLDTIQNSANNLRELVDNILDVTKVEAGKMTLIPKWFSVRSLCEEVVDTCSSRAIERGLELNYTLDSDVPLTVKGDPFRVRQVLLNLMGNSVKFTQTGEVYLRCYMRKAESLGSSQAYLSFDVIDTGRGFTEADFKRLFKQFGQIEGASQHDAGSGLGLFLSKQLVEMHGGELTVQSKAGEGSTFTFYVRVEVTHPSEESKSPEHPTSSRPGHRHSMSFNSTASASRPSSNTSPPFAPPGPKSVVLTPGGGKYTSMQTESPGLISPSVVSPNERSDGSVSRTNSIQATIGSSYSSQLPTPDSIVAASKSSATSLATSERQALLEKRAGSLPLLQRTQSDNGVAKAVLGAPHPETYSIVIICSAEHARDAIKQHIEQVVPHQIPVVVIALPSIQALTDMRHGPTPPVFTHVVLDLPHSSDIMLFMRQMASFDGPIMPSLIIVTDHYQKREIAEDFMALTSAGRKAFLIHKPVKPSVFAMIFDPAQLRILSKDRAREVAQSSSDSFKNFANKVRDAIGNRSHRLLLVEDSDTNRMVIQRYLKRVGLANDEARDGQECVDKVKARPHGYYNLIICDIQMPKKNGYEACLELRNWERDNGYPPTPIMALTAHAMNEERNAAGVAGFTDYLTKPVDFNRLGRMMMTLLDPNIPHVLLRDQIADERIVEEVSLS